MKFQEIYIDGFGIFYNYTINNISSALTIFVGPNEAGKSTILSFIKRILFGFPDKRSSSNLYPPLRGGNHGGRLIVLTGNNTRFIIERYSEESHDVKIILPNGSVGGSSELSSLVGHANRDIFENIFAFGLTELQDFETLSSEAVKGRLYSAGTGIGPISLPEFQKTIETEASELFKPKGSQPEINTLFKGINEINARLREIENDLQKFDDLHRDLEDITKKINNIEQERNRIRAKLSHIKNLITIWSDWRKIQEAKDSLQKIPKIENFPENGVEMMERNLEQVDELNNKITETNDKLNEIRFRKSQIKIDEKLISNKERILELQKGRDKYFSAAKDLPILRDKLKRDKEGLKESLHEIGPDWDEEKLSSFDISIPAKEIVRKKHKTIEEIIEKISDTEKESQKIDRDINNISEEIKEVDKNLETLSHQQLDEERLNQQKKSLQLLRAKYPSLKEKEANMSNLQEKEELFAIMKPRREENIQRLPLWPAVMFFSTGILTLILSILRNNSAIGIIILSILSASAIIYIILGRKKLLATKTEAPKGKEAEDLMDKSKDLSEQRKILGFELEKIKSEMLSNAQMCGLENIPDPILIEDKDSELQMAFANLLKLNDLKKQREKLYQNLNKTSEEENIVKRKLNELRKDEESARKEWKNWLTQKGLELELTPEGVIDIFATIKTCIEKKKSVEELTVRIKEQVQRYVEEYEIKMSSVLEDCNRKKKGINVIVELEKISEELNQAIDNSKNLKQLEIDEEKFRLELENLKVKLEERDKTISKLLSQGFAKSETEFRKNAKNWEELNKLKNEILQGEQNIKRISGEEKLYSDFINELKETTLETLKEEKLQLEEKFNEIEILLSNFIENRGGIAKEIEQIERREEGSSLRIEKAVKTQKLNKKSYEWSILVLARAIMRKAIEKYEKERQPEVIKEAQLFFSKMTLKRYSRIYAPLDEAKIYVEDRDGRQKDIQDLSRGTAEQLYLSLRFGFIREFSKRAEPLPIIFDDILVNFDPDRFQVACEAVKELIKTHQIFYFTCHPETIDLLTKIIPDSRKVDLVAGN